MNQKIEELLIELSMLNDDLRDTHNIINEKKKELRDICPHDKLTCYVNTATIPPIPEKFNRGLYVYTCQLCGYSETSNGSNPELEKKVVNE